MVHTKQTAFSSGRSRTIRAFRALRALRPSAALRLLGSVRTFRTRLLPAGTVKKLFRKISLGGVHTRRVILRLAKASLATAISFSILPFSYLMASAWPEGQAAASPLALGLLRNTPANAMSRWFGKLADSDRLPYVAHQRLIRMLIATYKIDITEIERPVHSYHTLQEFFSRRLRPDARPPHPRCLLVSPCDGELLMVGKVTGDDTIVQVKGNSFPLKQLLNAQSPFVCGPRSECWYFLFHLRPRDYHRFHCPCDGHVLEVCHLPGTLHPVTYTSSKWIPDLFAQNERVAVVGKWNGGEFAMVPIGATCVGSISLEFEQRIQTNKTSSVQNLKSLFRYASGETDAADRTPSENRDTYKPLSNTSYSYSNGVVPLRKGEPMGWFNWGSAIVVVIETPQGTGVVVKPHDEVLVGQPLISWA